MSSSPGAAAFQATSPFVFEGECNFEINARDKGVRTERKETGEWNCITDIITAQKETRDDIRPSLEMSLRRFFGYRKGQFCLPFQFGKDISGLLNFEASSLKICKARKKKNPKQGAKPASPWAGTCCGATVLARVVQPQAGPWKEPFLRVEILC